MAHILTPKIFLISQLQRAFNKMQLLKRFLKEHYFETFTELHYFFQNLI